MNVSGHGNVAEFMDGLQHTFVISPWLLIVPVLTGVMIARRWPSMVVLFMAILLAVIVALLVQSELVLRIAGDDGQGLLTSYKGMMRVCYGSTDIETGNQVLNELVHRWRTDGNRTVARLDATGASLCQGYGIARRFHCGHLVVL